MASFRAGLWGQAAYRVDRGALPTLVRVLAQRPEHLRAQMDRAAVAYVGRPGPPPTDEELDQAVAFWVRRTRSAGAWIGGVAGLPGLLGVAPESVAQLALLVRLAQRLAVVFGLDPQTDGGRLRVGEAVADALGVVLPAGGVAEASLRDLARAARAAAEVASPAPSTGIVQASTFGADLGAAARAALARTMRWTPGVGAAVGFRRGGADAERSGWRIAASLRRAAGLRPRPIVAEAEVVG